MYSNFGYVENEWHPLNKGSQLLLNTSIMTIGKDADGVFYHICNDVFDGVAEILKDIGVTHRQLAK